MSSAPPSTKGERTRAEIVAAAHELFIAHGYNAASMRQIAARAGIALGGIYNHFASKEEIFREVLFTYYPYREFLSALSEAPDGTLEDFLRYTATSMLSLLEARSDVLNLMFIEIVEFKTAHIPQLIEYVLPQLLPVVQRFTFQASDLQPIPTLVLIRSFLGLFFSYYVTGQMIGSLAPPEFYENAMDHFIDIYLHGILLPKASP